MRSIFINIIIIILTLKRDTAQRHLYYYTEFGAKISSQYLQDTPEIIFNYSIPKSGLPSADILVKNLTFLLNHESANCFVHLTSYDRVDIPKLISPVILRKPTPAFVKSRTKYSDGETESERVAWILAPHYMGSQYWINLTDDGCPASRFFTGINNHVRDLCNHIDFIQFSSHSKPWSCQIQASLFPPLHIFQKSYALSRGHSSMFIYDLHQTNIWYLDQNTYRQLGDYFSIIPSAVLDLRLMFVTTSYWKIHSMRTFDVLLQILKYTNEASQTSYLLFEVEIKDSNGAILAPIIGYSKYPHLLNRCYHCRHLDYVQKSQIYHSPDQGKIFWDLLHINSANEQNKLLAAGWCQLETGLASIFSKAEHKSNIQLSVEASKHVWWVILGNNSIVSKTQRRPCDKTKKLHKDATQTTILSFRSGFQHFPYHFPAHSKDTFNTFRFITCGRRELEPYPFKELVTVFDSKTWLSILAAAAFIPPVMYHLSGRKTSVIGEGLSVLKAFLEQGRSANRFQTVNFTSRLLASITILAGILLCNAYKSTNVYKIIAPRQPARYEHFDTLIGENFDIYGSSGVDFIATDLKNINYSLVENWEQFTIIGRTSIMIYSNLLSYVPLNKVDKIVLNYTAEIYPGVISKFSQELQSRAKELANLSNLNMIRATGEKMFDAIEEVEFLTSLRKFKKEALVVSQLRALRYKRALQSTGVSSSHIHIGKELYFESSIVYSFRGFVPVDVISRLKAMYTSGIWNWLEGVVQIINRDIEERHFTTSVQAASIEGNIVVIFCVLLGGILIAIFVALMEMMFSKIKEMCLQTKIGNLL